MSDAMLRTGDAVSRPPPASDMHVVIGALSNDILVTIMCTVNHWLEPPEISVQRSGVLAERKRGAREVILRYDDETR